MADEETVDLRLNRQNGKLPPHYNAARLTHIGGRGICSLGGRVE